MKNYKKPISALLKTGSLAIMQGTDKIIYSGLTNIINGGKQPNDYEHHLKYNEEDASAYQALQSLGVNLGYMLFSNDSKSVLGQSFVASLAVNLGIVLFATIDSFSAVERFVSELFKFGVCAGVNTAILGSIDWAIDYLIPDCLEEDCTLT